MINQVEAQRVHLNACPKTGVHYSRARPGHSDRRSRRGFGRGVRCKDFAVEQKGSQEPLTEADVAADALLKKELLSNAGSGPVTSFGAIVEDRMIA